MDDFKSTHVTSTVLEGAPVLATTRATRQNSAHSRRPSLRGLCLAAAIGSLLVQTVGCAGGAGLTREEIVAQVSTIRSLEAKLARAEEQGLDVLAPSGLNAAKESFDEALEKAGSGQTAEADKLAQKGLASLDRAEAKAAETSTVLRDVLAKRQRARAAGAPDLLTSRYEALEEDLREAANLVEQGRIDGAKDAEPALIRGYSKIELDSLKVDATDLAQKAIAGARKSGAAKYASDTFGRAEKELAIAVGILETDRSETARANVHARRASELAQQSQFIVDLVEEFDRRDYDSEAIVLWYQGQLTEVLEPLGGGVAFTSPNHEVVAGARSRIAAVVEGEKSVEAELAAARERLEALELTSTVSQADLKARLARVESTQREAQARYDRIQALFSEEEATVYRQGLNVLLEAHGFDFPVGQSEIQSGNFPLLNKIAKAIREFEDPKVVVSGHTDATGDNNANQKLSEERAAKVGNFLVEVAEIDGANVQTRGFGESKPVATNETAPGRARNRRIEILIVNR